MRIGELSAFAGILADPRPAGGRAHGEMRATIVDSEGVPVNEIECVALR